MASQQMRSALYDINPAKAVGPDKIHPMFLHHLGQVSISLQTRIFNKSPGHQPSELFGRIEAPEQHVGFRHGCITKDHLL